MITDYKCRTVETPSQSWNIEWKWGAVAVILIQTVFITYMQSSEELMVKPVSVDVQTDEVLVDEVVTEYEFYYILPNNVELVVPDYEVSTRVREEYFKLSKDKTYSLQVASFRNVVPANILAKRLTALGLSPKIEVHKNNDVAWNRVVISKLSILDVRTNKAILREKGIDSIVIQTARN